MAAEDFILMLCRTNGKLSYMYNPMQEKGLLYEDLARERM